MEKECGECFMQRPAGQHGEEGEKMTGHYGRRVLMEVWTGEK